MNKELMLASFCTFAIGVHSITSVGFCEDVTSLRILAQQEDVPQVTLFQPKAGNDGNGDGWRFHTTNEGGLLSILRKIGADYLPPYVTVTSNGNVGIGTTNPGSKLDVATEANTHVMLGNGVPEKGDSAIRIFYNKSGNYGMIDSFTHDVAQRNLVINPNGGNVGIGTSTPSHKLHVSGTGVFDNGVISIGEITAKPDERISLWYQGNRALGHLHGASGVALSFGAGGNNDHLFIHPNGNVGIGTTNPGAKLDVAGGIKSTMGRAQFSTHGDWNTTSTNWINTDVVVTLATTGGPLLLLFNTQACTYTTPYLIGLRFTVDDNPVTSAPMGNATLQTPPNTTTYQQPLAMMWLASDCGAGIHTVRVQARVTAGVGYIGEYSGAEGSERTLIVIEL